jgi:uncharacterized membrane protein (GlpM family)
MSFVAKLIITNLVIIGCVQLGKKLPSMAGLIATMPITTLAVLLWIHSENPSDTKLLTEYTRGVLWGIIPTALFFAAALVCFKRGLPLQMVITLSFAVWLTSAAFHQWLLR